MPVKRERGIPRSRMFYKLTRFDKFRMLTPSFLISVSINPYNNRVMMRVVAYRIKPSTNLTIKKLLLKKNEAFLIRPELLIK
jgi:hypothetical protein